MVNFWDLFRAQSEEERLKRKNADLDRKIRNKELEIKMIKKKLQGYRQNKFRKKMEKRPAKIESISIEGLNRTSDSLILATVERLFEVDNCRDLMQSCREVSKSLKGLGCFKSVNLYLDTTREPSPAHSQFRMRIIVREANCSPFLNIGLNTPRENLVSGALRAGLRNVFGAGEKLGVEYQKGISSFRLREISLVKPLHSLPPGSQGKVFIKENSQLEADLNSRVTEACLGSSLTVTGLSQKLNFTTGLSTSLFETKYNFGSDYPQHPCVARWSPNIASSGASLRARLTSSLTLDTRDDDLVPAQGLFCSARHILSSNLVGPNLANTVALRFCLHFSPLRGLSVSWRTLYSNTWASYQTLPQERDTHQGLLHTRGLMAASSIPLISTLGITSNLPFITSQSLIGKDVKFHTFLTGGMSPSTGLTQLQGLSTAAGLGLVGRVRDLARFELNINLPLSHRGTWLASGPFLSFSMGRDFL